MVGPGGRGLLCVHRQVLSFVGRVGRCDASLLSTRCHGRRWGHGGPRGKGSCPPARKVIGLQKRKSAKIKKEWINWASGVPAGGWASAYHRDARDLTKKKKLN
jgi:hypothetical protein